MGIALRNEESSIIELVAKSRAKTKSSHIGGTPGETPILRWAGSKKKILSRLLDIANIGSNGTYFEPFLGSGILFLGIKPKSAVLSDVNPHLIQAYRMAKSLPRQVWELLAEMPANPSFYYMLRSVDWDGLSPIERAARFIYLNRYCFNGVYRTNMNGNFNVARGEGHLGIPTWEVFEGFSKKLKNTFLLKADFENVISTAGKNDFIYIDPPYIDTSKRNRGEYGAGSFGSDDIARLKKSTMAASKRGAKILISYRYSKELIDSFGDWNIQRFDVQRCISCDGFNRESAKEILLTNYS